MGLELFYNDEMQGFTAAMVAEKADWKPLEGHGRVYTLPDRDEAGKVAQRPCAQSWRVLPDVAFMARDCRDVARALQAI